MPPPLKCMRGVLLCRAGKVTQEMLDVVDQRKFVVIGALEAAAQVISMICVSQLPGEPLFSYSLL